MEGQAGEPAEPGINELFPGIEAGEAVELDETAPFEQRVIQTAGALFAGVIQPVGAFHMASPIVRTWQDVLVCEVGDYPDKIGRIWPDHFYMWVKNFQHHAFMLLEHSPITASTLGYVSALKTDGKVLRADMSFTKLGLEGLLHYKKRHMGAGFSIGIGIDRQSVVEISLTATPRVCSTHINTLDQLKLDDVDWKRYGLRVAG